MKRLSLLSIFFVLFFTACDGIDPQIQFSGQDVSLGSAAANLSVQAGQSTVQSGTISGDDIPNDADLDEITLETSAMQFSATSKRAQSGSMDLMVTAGGYPIYAGTITVVNDVVTDINPSKTVIGVINATTVNRILGAVPADQRPSLQNYDGMTAGAIATAINTALKASSVALAVVVTNVTGDLRGSLTVSEMELGGSIGD